MGPNNLFRFFRQATLTAYNLNRAIGVPVFHRHPRMGDVAEHPFALPLYDEDYTVDLVWEADDTIDSFMLSKKLPVYDQKQFNFNCMNKLDLLVKCGERIEETRHMTGIDYFFKAAELETNPPVLNIDSISNLAFHLQQKFYPCVGIIYGRRCLPSQKRWMESYKNIAENYLRPANIRFIVQKFIQRQLKNTRFIAVHWRFDSDWLDMCKESRKRGARDRNAGICRLVMGLSYDKQIRDRFANNIKKIMKERNMQKIYLASPPNNIDLIRELKKSFGEDNFFYYDDMISFVNHTMYPGYAGNNYFSSFLEQELCFQSSFFLGAPLSSWTQSVLIERLAVEKTDYDDVLRIVTKGGHDPPPPGYPPLILQFPEGDFQFSVSKF